MFNLLVMGGGWPHHQSTFSATRIFEYTDEAIRLAHSAATTGINFQLLMQHPCLFMPEQNHGDNLARIGHINRVRPAGGRDVTIEYTFDPSIPAVSVDWIANISTELQMDQWEFSRTHWAVKDVDLYRVFLRSLTPRRNRPTVFNLSENSEIDQRQMSAMMPFDASFNGVYEAIRRAGAVHHMTVNRADDIWEHHQIIQDVVSLIDRSRIIVADCTGKNPNVFYEIGIAHALGREVILISQTIEHVPFDLRHLRVVTYLNNNEGLARLETVICDRTRTLLAQ